MGHLVNLILNAKDFQTWEGDNVNKKDKTCFIFAIDKMKINDIIEGQGAINYNQELGPIFIDQIKLLNKFLVKVETYIKRTNFPNFRIF